MTNPLSNPPYLVPPLVVLVASLVLVVVVWYGSRKSLSSKLFIGLLLSMGLWDLLLFGMRSSPDAYRALLWEKGLPVTIYITFILFYHFTLAYTNNRGQRGILLASYVFLVAILALSPTELFIERMRLEDYGYAPVVNPLAFPIMMSVPLLMGGGAYNLLRRYNRSLSYEERNRLLYLVTALVFPLTGMFLDAFSNLPPASIWCNLIFCIICTIAILKYHLLDIRVIARKSLAYLFVSLMIAVPYVSILLLLHQILRARMEPWWVHAIIVLLLALLLQPLYSWAQNFMDRLFYRDRYDYLRALQQFSQKAQSIINLKELSSTLTQLVSGALRTSSVCLLLQSESDNGLIVVSSIGLGDPPSGVVLRGRSPLIKCLKLQQHILSSEEFDIVPQLQSLSLRERGNLEQMEAKLYVPIQARPAQLSGILVLGQKLSQQPYSSEDEQLLTALSSQMAIALENARLYNESQQELRERKRAEEALQVEKNKLQSLIDAMEDGLTIQDTEYNIIYQNEPVRIRHGDHLGEKCYRVYEGKEKVCEGCPVEKAFKDGKSHTSERRVVLPSGEVTFWEVTANPTRDAGGRIVSCIEVPRNITERKQAEKEEQRLQQELYESGRLAAIGELAAGVAHEINNPLTAILGFSQRVLRKSRDKSITRDLERVSGEALRAAKIVQNLLAFARRREPKREDCNVSDILQRALELRAYELRTSNIEVVANLAPNLPKVMADSHQIQEVFLNVILNAEQAMVEAHQGGALVIKTCKNEGYAQVVFSDDGPGIAKENLGRIFHPFFSTRADKGGTGLGLSICHGIVTEHGGKIYAKSRLGEGATFVVELPVATGETSRRKTAEKKSAKKADRHYQPI